VKESQEELANTFVLTVLLWHKSVG